MDTLEIAASNLEEARAKAASQLGVDPSLVKLTVIEETKGLFGQGKVRVKAEAETAAPAPTRASRAKAKTETKAEAKAEAAPEAPVEEEKPKRGRTSRKKDDAPAATATPEATEAVDSDSNGAAAPEVAASAKDADSLVGILNSLMEAADLDVNAKSTGLNGKYINVELDGRDVSYLVGRRGEVLNALQYLLNVICSRKVQPGVRVVVEGDSFRQRRADVLTKLALDIAEEVRNRSEEAVLDALPAFERRIVHQALVEFDGVTTYSEGEEPNRRVVIAPAE